MARPYTREQLEKQTRELCRLQGWPPHPAIIEDIERGLLNERALTTFARVLKRRGALAEG